MKKDEILSIVGIGRISVVDPAKSDPRIIPKKAFNHNNEEAMLISSDLTLSAKKAADEGILAPQPTP